MKYLLLYDTEAKTTYFSVALPSFDFSAVSILIATVEMNWAKGFLKYQTGAFLMSSFADCNLGSCQTAIELSFAVVTKPVSSSFQVIVLTEPECHANL